MVLAHHVQDVLIQHLAVQRRHQVQLAGLAVDLEKVGAAAVHCLYDGVGDTTVVPTVLVGCR